MTPARPTAPRPTPLRPRGSNHVGMRQFNERVVLQAVRLHGNPAKAELARLTGLTAQTIGMITARLEDDGLLLRQARVRGRVGQPSVPLVLNPDGAYAIGVHVGRRRTDTLVVDFVGRIRARRQCDYAFPERAKLLPTLQRHLTELRAELGEGAARLVGVGVAAPFQMGGWHRLLGLSELQSQDWNQVNLAEAVQAMTDLPVHSAKDTAAACVAELVQGRGHDLPSFLYLFVDTFVGGALVLHSHLHAGVGGNAGAVASLPCHLAGATTQAAAPTQLIAHASLWELEQRLRAAGLDAGGAYDGRACLPPYAQETARWMACAADALAWTIASGAAFLDVGAVVIDASVHRETLTALIALTCQALARYNWEGMTQPQVVAGTVGPDARALGGALFPLYANFAPDQDLFLKAG